MTSNILDGFEKYQKKSIYIKKPAVTILKRKGFYINTSAMENCVKEHQYAELYYNKSQNKIAIKFVNESGENVYKITRRGNNKTGYIGSKTFIEHYKIGSKEYRQHLAIWDEKEKVLIVDLNKNLKVE